MGRLIIFLSLCTIGAVKAQYYTPNNQGQPQPNYYQPQPYYNQYPNNYPYPQPQPQQQQQSRQDYSRAITIGQGQPGQPQPWPYAYYPQPVPNFPPEPLTESIFKHDDPDHHRYLTPPSLKFKIGIVAEKMKDENRDEDTGLFKSYLREGHLYIQKNKTNPDTPNITLEWDEEKGTHPLQSGINFGGKGFHLATLNVFNGKLYACDDATGVLYELKKVEDEEDDDNNKNNNQREPERFQQQQQYRNQQYRDNRYREPYDPRINQNNNNQDNKPEEEKYHYVAQPWLILSNENSNEGFKCKWGVVRNNQLWIGSTGSLTPKNKSDEENSELSKERQIVKQIEPSGEVTDVDFSKHYDELAEAYEVNLRQGHVIHEAVAWSDLHNKWVWAPRKVTKEKKNKDTWDRISTNEVALSDDKFEDVTLQKFGNLTETQGFVGLRFIPGTQDRFLVALKAGADEYGEVVSTLAVYDLKGNQIMPETKVADGTYAGVEFL